MIKDLMIHSTMSLSLSWKMILLFLFIRSNVRNRNLAFASTNPTLECPSSGFEVIPSGNAVRLAIASKGKLCTLTQSNVDGTTILPVGRSYDGFEWESVAGPYPTLSYQCDNASCEVTLPQLNDPNQRFQLTSFGRNISRKDTLARFFEQATFGTTEEDLKKLADEDQDVMDLNSYFANWTHHQIYQEKLTSHRNFWRERTLSHSQQSYWREGKTPRPCEKGSHWRGYAFTKHDVNENVQIELKEGVFSFSIGGELRTTVSSFQLEETLFENFSFPLIVRVCWVQTHISGHVTLAYDGKCRTLIGGNPHVSIHESTDYVALIDSADMSEFVLDEAHIHRMILGSNIQSDQCALDNKSIFIKVNHANSVQHLLYDPRLMLKENLMVNPLSDGGGGVLDEAGGDKVQCSNVVRNFLNENSCRLATDQQTCSPKKYIAGSVKLNIINMKKLFEGAWRYVYGVTNLRLEDDYEVESPCEDGVRSRWKQYDDLTICDENVHSETASIFRKLIEDGNDPNPHVKDLFLPSGKTCHWDDQATVQMTIEVGTVCWRTVHPDHLDVYDFSGWSQNHPGNDSNKKSIKQFALDGSYTLKYPSFHSMDRWKDQKKNLSYLGRLGDEVEFKNFPDSLRTVLIADLFGLVTPTTEDGTKAIICGSPFEGKSKLFHNSFSITRRPGLDFLKPHQFAQQKRTVWIMIATTAADQLRQRVAWALSQVLVVSPSAIAFPIQTESFLTYYDIFVRNAFKSFRNVLKEVAYSPMMAEMLSYLDSRSKEFVWNEQKENQFPDENFSREIMQLFSIGLVKLNNDGTPALDANNNTIATYNNDEIQEFARVWTGFRRQQQRGNVEERGINMNTIDPMAIHLPWRDQYPKMGLNGKYIGDQYALCFELPSNSFLKRNAKYRLLGKAKVSDIQKIPPEINPLTLDKSSPLYSQLCQQNANGKCSYPAVVYLSSDFNCHADECDVSDLKIVHLGDNVHYEYVRPPCVHQSFTKSKKQIIVVDPNGKVAFEHNEDSQHTVHSLTYFRVAWGNQYPNADNFCGNGACQEVSGRCRCEVIVEEDRVFSSSPTRSEILSQLYVGALPPNMYHYSGNETYPEFTLFYKNVGQKFGDQSAFEVKDDFGNILLLKNVKSTVVVMRWGEAEYSPFDFRNPVSFYDESPEVKDAQYETDAALDQYFYHQNTGPFLAMRLIQRFGISNPSPRYVNTVAEAFRHGKYIFDNGSVSFSFGSAKYGDLAATVAAIIMDRESRATVLDADLSFGGMREPLIKVISLMRGMAYTQTSREFASLYDLDAKIGQSPHYLPSVFSFFLPEFAPPGVIAQASLVAPESMLLQNSIGLVNGLISLLKYGLNICDGGFGGQKQCWTDLSDGYLSYSTSDPTNGTQVVDDLASLLTSGRLSEHHRNLIEELYSNHQNKAEALKLAQQLIVLSPEFSALGISRETQEKRPELASPTKTCQEYKAVVHILLKGGCDSFNLLVPHSRCSDRDMYDEYKSVRGSVGLPKADLLQINTENSNQVCNTFGIHPNLPIIKDLYNDGDAAFLAGIGVMTEPVSKENYELKTKTTLFAHNTIQAEIGRLDPFVSTGNTATLGRLVDVLSSKFNVNAFSVDTGLVALEGNADTPKTAVNSAIGFQKFNPSASKDDIINSKLQWINGAHDVNSNFFTQTWSSSLHESIILSDRLSKAQNSVKLNSTFPDSKFGEQLQLISKIITSNECRGSSRDIFYVETGNFDHHSNVLNNLQTEFDLINDGLASFVDEMKSSPRNIWDKVTVVVSSDFGRTMSSNSGGGTDHGWSGINMMLGGSVDGGKIIGEYPKDLRVDNELDIGRGRFIPTMPFEAPWNAVSQWLGVEDELELEKILPNRKSFPNMLLDSQDTFIVKWDYQEESCDDEGVVVSCVATEIDYDDDQYYYDDVDDYDEVTKGNVYTIVIIATIIPILIVMGLIVRLRHRTMKKSNLYNYFEDKSSGSSTGKDDTFDSSDEGEDFESGGVGFEVVVGNSFLKKNKK